MLECIAIIYSPIFSINIEIIDSNIIIIKKIIILLFAEFNVPVNMFTISLVKNDVSIGIRLDIILCTKRKIVYGTDALSETHKLNLIKEKIFFALFIIPIISLHQILVEAAEILTGLNYTT